MRWLFGVILGLIVIFAGLFVVEQTGRFDQLKAILDEGYTAKLTKPQESAPAESESVKKN